MGFNSGLKGLMRMKHWYNQNCQESWSPRRKICPSVVLPFSNPVYTALGSKLVHGERRACNFLSLRPGLCMELPGSDVIYLLTAIGLSPGGSITVHIYTQTIHRTTQFRGSIGNYEYVRRTGFVFVPDGAFTNKTRNTQHVGYYMLLSNKSCDWLCFYLPIRLTHRGDPA